MKNRIYLLLVIAIAIFTFSFTRSEIQPGQDEKKPAQSKLVQKTKNDTLPKLQQLKTSVDRILDVPITNHPWALDCLKRYNDFLQSHIKSIDETPVYTPKTKEVVFDKQELINWINRMGTGTVNIAIRFAKFQDESENDENGYNKNENSRSVTVFLWPYSDKYTPVPVAQNKYPFMSYKKNGQYKSALIDDQNKYQWAGKCIYRYETFFDEHKISGDDESKELDPANKKPMYSTKTTEVVFSKDSLLNWLNSLGQTIDSIHFQYGRYQNENEPDQDNNNNNIHSRRLTVFLWPYQGKNRAINKSSKKNQVNLVDPFNLGEIHP